MPFTTLHQIHLDDLLAMADGTLEDTISDLDFLETLAAHRCLIVPPYILRASPTGALVRVTALQYDLDGKLDKARILVNTAHALAHAVDSFHPRIS